MKTITLSLILAFLGPSISVINTQSILQQQLRQLNQPNQQTLIVTPGQNGQGVRIIDRATNRQLIDTNNLAEGEEESLPLNANEEAVSNNRLVAGLLDWLEKLKEKKRKKKEKEDEKQEQKQPIVIPVPVPAQPEKQKQERKEIHIYINNHIKKQDKHHGHKQQQPKHDKHKHHGHYEHYHEGHYHNDKHYHGKHHFPLLGHHFDFGDYHHGGHDHYGGGGDHQGEPHDHHGDYYSAHESKTVDRFAAKSVAVAASGSNKEAKKLDKLGQTNVNNSRKQSTQTPRQVTKQQLRHF